jgi:hypothetical protein
MALRMLYAVYNLDGEKYAERIIKTRDPLGIDPDPYFYLIDNSGDAFDYGQKSLKDLMRVHGIRPGNIRHKRPAYLDAQIRRSKRDRAKI